MTLLRILMLPAIVVIYMLDNSWSNYGAAGLFALAGLTDWMDGWIARSWQVSSRLGSFIDPVADKILVIAVLFSIVYQHHSLWVLGPAIVIAVREITMSSLREWLADQGERDVMAVENIGKIKTALQMTATFMLLLSDPASLPAQAGVVILCVSACMSVFSMVKYLIKSWQVLVRTANE